MLALKDTSVDMPHDSGGENTQDFEVDPMLIERYMEAFGVMSPEVFDLIIKKETFDLINANRDKVVTLLYEYPKKLDASSIGEIQPKIVRLREAGLTVKQILDICEFNILVLSSPEDKYWKKINILIILEIPAQELYDLLITGPDKKTLDKNAKKFLPNKSKSH